VGLVLNVLFFLILVVVPIAALCMQTMPLRIASMTFHDTTPDYAWRLVAQYAEGTFEQRFGYPTGYFHLDDKRSQQPSKIVMRELQPAGAVTDGCSSELSLASLSGFEGGCLAGCLGMMAVGCIGAPFFLVSTFDRFFRFMLRSRVDVQLAASGPDTVASFAFYGPGGYSLRSRYAQVFEKPTLPAELAIVYAPSPGEQHAAGAAA
jgi:hypothetical protein